MQQRVTACVGVRCNCGLLLIGIWKILFVHDLVTICSVGFEYFLRTADKSLNNHVLKYTFSRREFFIHCARVKMIILFIFFSHYLRVVYYYDTNTNNQKTFS